jgi:hypothetical protein
MARFSWPPILIAIPFLLALWIIYYMDPTHDYPKITVETPLGSNETITVTIPPSSTSLFGMIENVFPITKGWIRTSSSFLILADTLMPLVPDVMFGFENRDREIIRVMNVLNATQLVFIEAFRAPPPDQQSKYKGYWYVILACAQVIVSMVYSVMSGGNKLPIGGRSQASTNGSRSGLAMTLCCPCINIARCFGTCFRSCCYCNGTCCGCLTGTCASEDSSDDEGGEVSNYSRVAMEDYPVNTEPDEPVSTSPMVDNTKYGANRQVSISLNGDE